MELTVALTGASGTIYAYRTLQLLAESGAVSQVNLIMSGTSATVEGDGELGTGPVGGTGAVERGEGEVPGVEEPG